MLLSAVSVLVVAQLSSVFPEGLMNYPVFYYFNRILIWPTTVSHNVDINSIGDCGLLGDIPDILKKTSL
jgi:hypothetical protein